MPENKGLEGVVVANSKISSIIGSQLTYGGYEIDDLAENALFEEVVYLLWNDKLPNQQELEAFNKELFNLMNLDDNIYKHFELYPLDKVHPMSAVRTALSLTAHFDENAEDKSMEASQQKAVRILAQLPALVAAFARIRNGKDVVKPKEGLNYAANFLYMLNGEEPTDTEVEAMNKVLVLHADHELNASTFTARVCVGTESDVYSGVTAAIGALKGPLHGGANEQVMAMLKDIGTLDNAESYIQKKFDNKEKIMGMGHRVYKDGDPRAKYLKDMSKKLTDESGNSELFDISTKIAEIVKEEKGLLPNVDFYSATVYHSMGIESDLFTPIFAMSRASGWTAHILEQYADNRLIRPRAEYVGATDRKYEAIENR